MGRGGGGDGLALAEDAAALGITLETETGEPPAPTPTLVWPENSTAVDVFIGMSTQWRWLAVGGLGGGVLTRTGLDYSALPAVAQALRVRLDADLLWALRILESETISSSCRGDTWR